MSRPIGIIKLVPAPPNIYERRLALNPSQKELSRLAKCSARYISEMERHPDMKIGEEIATRIESVLAPSSQTPDPTPPQN